jgi:hypothetical protein
MIRPTTVSSLKNKELTVLKICFDWSALFRSADDSGLGNITGRESRVDTRLSNTGLLHRYIARQVYSS